MDSLKLTSLVILVSVGLIFIALERIYPYTPGQKFFRKGIFTDFFLYAILQSYVLGLLIFGLINWIDSSSGLSRLQIVTDWPIWVQLVFFTVLHDFYIYWFHRWMHASPVLWRVHEAHHSPKAVDWIAGMRSHSLEIIINQTIEFAPIILLGAPPEVAIFKGTIDGIWGMWIHANINVKSGFFQYIINGPEMHRWHHANEVRYGNTNFATKFAWWDWIFRTAWLPEEKPKAYGLADVDFPENYFKQHWFAFRKF